MFYPSFSAVLHDSSLDFDFAGVHHPSPICTLSVIPRIPRLAEPCEIDRMIWFSGSRVVDSIVPTFICTVAK